MLIEDYVVRVSRAVLQIYDWRRMLLLLGYDDQLEA